MSQSLTPVLFYLLKLSAALHQSLLLLLLSPIQAADKCLMRLDLSGTQPALAGLRKLLLIFKLVSFKLLQTRLGLTNTLLRFGQQPLSLFSLAFRELNQQLKALNFLSRRHLGLSPELPGGLPLPRLLFIVRRRLHNHRQLLN